MRERTDDAWFTNWRNAVDQVGQITLVCLPHAGAGASVYARWAALLPPWIDLVGITLPGRESRISESPLTSMDEVISRLGPAVSARVQEPFALFGHSLGALIGYELACWLGTRCGGIPEALLGNLELREVFLPALRGDMSILERYRFGRRLPAGTDLLVLGASDDPTTTASELHAWSELTRGSTTVTILPDGGHFYTQTRPRQVTEAIVDELVARTTPW